MKVRTSLRRRILLGLLGYAAALTLAVFVHGIIVNENAEALVWKTLFDSELDHIVDRMASDPGYQWVDSPSIALFDGRHGPLPPELRGLAPGVHDEIVVDGGMRVVLVRQLADGPVALALDITDLERQEQGLWVTVMVSAIVMVALVSLLVLWGADRLVRPLTLLAARIESLEPDKPGQCVDVPESASTELVVIAESLNDYLRRNDSFVQRERAFIDTASHELRTPIAIIAGASGIALEQPGIPASVRGQLARIRHTSADVERLIAMLLVLAKDPRRLAKVADRIALDRLVGEIVEQHVHLTRGKDLEIEVAPSPGVEVVAPVPVVRTAIGNLLRNAIENSDRGTITVRLEPPATVVISDPGHGMSPEEVSAIYARLARGGGDRIGGGIGLELIARLCEHLGWTLDVQSDPSRGTVARLALSSLPSGQEAGA
ncbi:MAG: HAMP domain-containing histidine kinase [Proteobacteria bacterium]|nr:HAMP domain-containing histidine kinase [Pseudomonadota bacterium]